MLHSTSTHIHILLSSPSTHPQTLSHILLTIRTLPFFVRNRSSPQVVKMPYYSLFSHTKLLKCLTIHTNSTFSAVQNWAISFYPSGVSMATLQEHSQEKMWLLMPFDIPCFLPLPPYLPKLLKVLSKILLHTVRTQSTNKDSLHLRQKGRGGGGGGKRRRRVDHFSFTHKNNNMPTLWVSSLYTHTTTRMRIQLKCY